MTAHIERMGDHTSRDVKPDFESERYYHWQHMIQGAKRAGTLDKMPYKPRRGLAEESFFGQVDRRLSRVSTRVGISFDTNGKVIRGHE